MVGADFYLTYLFVSNLSCLHPNINYKIFGKIILGFQILLNNSNKTKNSILQLKYFVEDGIQSSYSGVVYFPKLVRLPDPTNAVASLEDKHDFRTILHPFRATSHALTLTSHAAVAARREPARPLGIRSHHGVPMHVGQLSNVLLYFQSRTRGIVPDNNHGLQ